jgi:hypothetical protein
MIHWSFRMVASVRVASSMQAAECFADRDCGASYCLAEELGATAP